MTPKFRLLSAVLGLAVIAGCQQEEPMFDAVFRKVHTKPLPDSSITIGGAEYVVKRATALEGRKKGQEVWAIVYKGQTYSCPTATTAGCANALNRAKADERRGDGDMGY